MSRLQDNPPKLRVMSRSGPRSASGTGERAVSTDELPSWRETTAKQSIMRFVEAVTDHDSPDFVPERDRVAVFDNDGTLWTEQPAYAQLVFALERAGRVGPSHRPRRTARGRDARPDEASGAHPRRHHHRPIRRRLPGLAGIGPTPALQATLPLDGVPADVGTAQPAGSSRLLLLDLLGRRHRLYANVG